MNRKYHSGLTLAGVIRGFAFLPISEGKKAARIRISPRRHSTSISSRSRRAVVSASMASESALFLSPMDASLLKKQDDEYQT